MKSSCQECGFPYDPGDVAQCPKCGSGLDDFGYIAVLEIDVVHAGECWPTAKSKIERGLDKAIFGHHKGLKVIHGYGSQSGSSVIAPQAIAYMRHLSERHAARFAKDHQNPGASLIWLNRKTQIKTNPDSSAQSSPSTQSSVNNDWFDKAMKQARNTI